MVLGGDLLTKGYISTKGNLPSSKMIDIYVHMQI
jgi:hypothetical protein